MNQHRRNLRLGTTAACIAAVSAVGAIAPGAASAQELSDAAVFDEVLVTARKRQESILDIPSSVTALSAEQIEAKNAKDLEDLARSVPSLVIQSAGENEPKQFILRGIGPAFGTSATVAVYMNDAPVTVGANSPDLKVFDMERIEVLRGPQGTLFGSSSMGGAIRYVTPKPDFEEFTGRFKLETGAISDGGTSYEGQAALGGPISENVAFRASGFYRKDGGYIDVVDETTGQVSDEDANAYDSFGGQLALGMRFGESVDVTASVLYQDTEQDDLNFYHSLLGMSDPPVPLDDLQKTERVDVQLRDTFLLPSLVVNADLGFGTLTSATSAQQHDVDLTNDLSYFIQGLFGIPGSELQVPSIRTRTFDAFIQELRLASDGEGRFGWLIGAYYRETKSTTDQVIPSNIDVVLGIPADQFLPVAPGAIETLEEEFRGKELAGFGELSFNLTDALELTGGLRYSELKRDVMQVETFAPLLGGGAAVVDPPESTESVTTPRFSASYTFSDDHMLYAVAAKGFREGGPNPPLLLSPECLASLAEFGLSSPPISFESDNLWSYEVGLKMLAADGRLRLQGSVYQIDWTEIQTAIPVGTTCGTAPVANVGGARARGVETEISWQPVEQFLLELTAAYTDAETTEDVEPFNVSAGTPLGGVPEWSGSMAAQYDTVFSNGWRGYIRGELQYVGDANRFLDNGGGQSNLHRGAYEIAALRLGVDTTAYEFALFADNLFDERVVIGEGFGAFAPGIDGQGAARTTIRPRTIGLSAAFRF